MRHGTGVSMASQRDITASRIGRHFGSPVGNRGYRVGVEKAELGGKRKR